MLLSQGLPLLLFVWLRWAAAVFSQSPMALAFGSTTTTRRRKPLSEGCLGREAVVLCAKKKKQNLGKGRGGGGGFGSPDREEAESTPAMERASSAATVAKLKSLFEQEAAAEHIPHPELGEAATPAGKDTPNSDSSLPVAEAAAAVPPDASSLLVRDAAKNPSEETSSILESLGLYTQNELDSPQEEEGATTFSEEGSFSTKGDPRTTDETIVADDHSRDERATLAARYTEEYWRQESLTNSSNKKQLVQVSESPLIFTIDEFLDPDACKRIGNDAAGCYSLFYPEKLSDDLFDGQESEMDGLLFNAASSKDHEASEDPYPDGLHMDTNNRCANRHVTCILYLNDVPEECGGATVFPLARTLPGDPVLEASRRLLQESISHTRQQLSKWDPLKADAKLLEQRTGTAFPDDPTTQTAIKIQPKAGRLLVFFSRDSNGHEDPRAWHAGETILASGSSTPVEKRILTLFKEVDYEDKTKPLNANQGPLEDYLAPMVAKQRDWLQAKAKLQRALLGYSSSLEEP